MSTPSAPLEPSSTGLAPNVAGALAYVLGPITGVLFLVMEKQSRFVRFHAMQSTLVWVVWIVISVVLNLIGFVPLVGWLVSFFASVGMAVIGFALWLLLMWKAFQGEEWEVPVIGSFARQQIPAS